MKQTKTYLLKQNMLLKYKKFLLKIEYKEELSTLD